LVIKRKLITKWKENSVLEDLGRKGVIQGRFVKWNRSIKSRFLYLRLLEGSKASKQRVKIVRRT